MRDLINIAVLILVLQTGAVLAHDSTGQFTEWMQDQHNARGGACCNGTDAMLLEDNEWRTNGTHYEVYYEGKWHEVPDYAATTTKQNITGKAVLWLWRGEPVCFKPANFW